MERARLHIACLGHLGPLSRYWPTFDCLEVPVTPPVSPKTLGRWRREAPKPALLVPRVSAKVVAAGFKGPEAEAGWTETLDLVARAEASAVLLRTPSDFRPTTENAKSLVDFFTPRLTSGLKVAWWAEGLWEGQPEERDAIRQAAGLTPVIDPLALERDEEPTPGDFFYWRLLGGRGLAGRFSDHDLDRLLGFMESRSEGILIFTSPQMRRDASRFAKLADAALTGERQAL